MEGGRQREALFLFSIGEKIFYSFVNQFLLHEIHFAADSLSLSASVAAPAA